MSRESADFSPADIRLIRSQAADGLLNVRAWADARKCGLETIRRIARRDTYRDVSDEGEVLAPLDGPSDDDIAASLRKLTAAANNLPPQTSEVNSILDELTKRGQS